MGVGGDLDGCGSITVFNCCVYVGGSEQQLDHVTMTTACSYTYNRLVEQDTGTFSINERRGRKVTNDWRSIYLVIHEQAATSVLSES